MRIIAYLISLISLIGLSCLMVAGAPEARGQEPAPPEAADPEGARSRLAALSEQEQRLTERLHAVQEKLGPPAGRFSDEEIFAYEREQARLQAQVAAVRKQLRELRARARPPKPPGAGKRPEFEEAEEFPPLAELLAEEQRLLEALRTRSGGNLTDGSRANLEEIQRQIRILQERSRRTGEQDARPGAEPARAWQLGDWSRHFAAPEEFSALQQRHTDAQRRLREKLLEPWEGTTIADAAEYIAQREQILDEIRSVEMAVLNQLAGEYDENERRLLTESDRLLVQARDGMRAGRGTEEVIRALEERMSESARRGSVGGPALGPYAVLLRAQEQEWNRHQAVLAGQTAAVRDAASEGARLRTEAERHRLARGAAAARQSLPATEGLRLGEDPAARMTELLNEDEFARFLRLQGERAAVSRRE